MEEQIIVLPVRPRLWRHATWYDRWHSVRSADDLRDCLKGDKEA